MHTFTRLALALAIFCICQAHFDFDEELDNSDALVKEFDDTPMIEADEIVPEQHYSQEAEMSSNGIMKNEEAKDALLWEKWTAAPADVAASAPADQNFEVKKAQAKKATTSLVRTKMRPQQEFVQAFYTSGAGHGADHGYGSGHSATYGSGHAPVPPTHGRTYGSGHAPVPPTHGRTYSSGHAPAPLATPTVPANTSSPVQMIHRFSLMMPIDHTMFGVMKSVLVADMAAQLGVHASEVTCNMGSNATASTILLETSLVAGQANHAINFEVKAVEKDAKTAKAKEDSIRAKGEQLVSGKEKLAGVTVPKQKLEMEVSVKAVPAKKSGIASTSVPNLWLAVAVGLISMHSLW